MNVLLKSQQAKIIGLTASILLGLMFMIGSVMFGITTYSWDAIWESFRHFNGTNEHLIIQTARIPRALIGASVGASLAVAGALMQAITRNPLASPSLFGVNAGAAFMIVMAVGYIDWSSSLPQSWIGFFGAGVGAGIVYFLGSIGRDGMTPVKITLAGSAVTAFFASMTQGILLTNGKAFDQVLIWLVGSIAGREMNALISVLPYMVIALFAALILSRHINILAMGEDVAQGLGQRTVLIKLVAALVIIALAGGSVAAAGPIVFVGIIVPHIVRYLVGTDYRWIVPYCMVLGAILLLGADIGARFIAMPKEVPVGVVTALIGVPFFVAIARKGGGA
jgi:iron complex transport system permease protein